MQTKTKRKDTLLKQLTDLNKMFGDDIVVTLSVSNGKVSFENTFRKRQQDFDDVDDTPPDITLKEYNLNTSLLKNKEGYFG